MQRNTLVLVTNNPDIWGFGVILQVRNDGLIDVSFEDGRVEAFRPGELEEADRWMEAA